MSTLTDLIKIKEFFTDKELDAIYEAMRDYADYGDEQAEIADSILSKIALL
jgi:hypothetical protein